MNKKNCIFSHPKLVNKEYGLKENIKQYLNMYYKRINNEYDKNL